jgi:hypothetical protein
MPKISITETELVVSLSPLERIAALSGDIRVPLKDLRGATIDPGIMKNIGFRAPGTHLPGKLWAGHFLRFEAPVNHQRQPRFVYALAPLKQDGQDQARATVIVAGKAVGSLAHTFVYVKKPATPLVITLANHKYDFLVLGVENAKALESQINSL